MAVIVIGVNHRTMPLDQFERMTLDASRLPKALADVCSRANITEAVVLSTCNRTEVYAVAERFHGAYSDIRDFLAEHAFMAPEEFADHLYVHYDDSAVRHLFSVAAGLDSVVVGETEILGQVKSAWEVARAEGAAGSMLNMAFRHAVEVGKRARTETSIARHVASASAAAVAMAADHLGGLEHARALVVGAGEMGEGMVVALAGAGVSDVRIANRTPERAEALATRVGGSVLGLSEVPGALADVDLLLTSTGAHSLLLEQADLEPLLEARADRPLLIVDIAVPRDVDSSIGLLPGVTLLDMDDLRRFAEVGLKRRRGEVVAVQGIVNDELERFDAACSARAVAPLVATLHERAEQVRLDEVDRFSSRLDSLDDRQREAVEALTRGILGKLLHGPTVKLKDLAGTARGERLADALRDLYDLELD